ncbi:MAG: phage virion morphogenesis protein [Alphaproteobacteria bacterium]|nr:phage virion morphogenesis protein [Alphaproteobacteria bacterium]
MSGISFQIDDKELLDKLNLLAASSERPQAMMHAIGAAMVQSTQRRFEREAGPDGRPWPKLSPRTANKRLGRSRRGYAHMLRVTGRLYQSISYQADGLSVAWGTNVVYGPIHQLGGTIDMPARSQRIYLRNIRKGGQTRTRFGKQSHKTAEPRDVNVGPHTITIPARPYLGLSAADREEIIAQAVDFYRKETGA